MPGEHSYGKQQLSAWVTDDVAEKVEARAEADRVTKSDVVRAAVEMYLESGEAGEGSLARIEAKLDAVLATMPEHDAGMAEPVDDCGRCD